MPTERRLVTLLSLAYAVFNTIPLETNFSPRHSNRYIFEEWKEAEGVNHP